MTRSPSKHIPTKKEIAADIRAASASVPDSSDPERDVRAFIDQQYDQLHASFWRALGDDQPPSFTKNLSTTSGSMWQLATMLWRYRWLIVKYGVYGVSTQMTGIVAPLSMLLSLVDSFTTWTIAGLLAMRMKRHASGKPRLSKREMLYVKIILTCLEWVRKLYELPITFSWAMVEAAHGHLFTRTEIEQLANKLELEKIEKRRRYRAVKIHENRKQHDANIQRKLFPHG